MIYILLFEFRIKRIIPLLFSHGGQGTMPGTHDRIVGKRKDVLAIVGERIGI